MNRIIYDLPAEDYFRSPALNKSTLHAFATIGDMEQEETAAMRLGSLVHCAILEPGEIENRYHVTDVKTRGTKAWSAEVEKACGKEVVKREDYDAAMLIGLSVREEPDALEILNGCASEVTAFWRHEGTGLNCKARADIFKPGLIADLKTCQSIKNGEFVKAFYDRHYDWQASWYWEGFEACGESIQTFKFIAVESKAKLIAGTAARRHQVGIFEMSKADLERARAEVNQWREMYAYCARTGDWLTNPKGVQVIEKPEWMINKEERQWQQ